MIRSLLFGLVFVGLFSAAASAAISVTSVTRSTKTDIGDGAPQDYTSTSRGSYNATFLSMSNLNPAGIISANAMQGSFVPNSIGVYSSGFGSTRAQAAATGVASFSAAADSSLDMYFTVTSNQMYKLSSNVAWIDALPGAFGGFTRVQLMDVTNATVPYDSQRDSMIPGTASVVSTIPLSVGPTYRLQAESHVIGGGNTAGNFTGDAGWDFLLSVPEPGCEILLGIGTIALSGLRTRRSRNR